MTSIIVTCICSDARGFRVQEKSSRSLVPKDHARESFRGFELYLTIALALERVVLGAYVIFGNSGEPAFYIGGVGGVILGGKRLHRWVLLFRVCVVS